MRRRYNMVYHTIDVIIWNEFFLFFYIILMKNRFYYNETNAYNITTVCVHVRVYIYTTYIAESFGSLRVHWSSRRSV